MQKLTMKTLMRTSSITETIQRGPAPAALHQMAGDVLLGQLY
jgi:hypothetical protein